MNAHTTHEIAFTALRPSQIVDEYNRKSAMLGEALATFEQAGNTLKTAATIGGTWGNVTLDTGNVWERELERSLLTSAWRHIYDLLNLDVVASALDKRKFEQAMANPPPFTLDNIRASFGQYIADPRGSILRGLAEVFSSLDPAFRSHDGEVPPEDSQGSFVFGLTCAKRKLSEHRASIARTQTRA